MNVPLDIGEILLIAVPPSVGIERAHSKNIEAQIDGLKADTAVKVDATCAVVEKKLIEDGNLVMDGISKMNHELSQNLISIIDTARPFPKEITDLIKKGYVRETKESIGIICDLKIRALCIKGV